MAWSWSIRTRWAWRMERAARLCAGCGCRAGGRCCSTLGWRWFPWCCLWSCWCWREGRAAGRLPGFKMGALDRGLELTLSNQGADPLLYLRASTSMTTNSTTEPAPTQRRAASSARPAAAARAKPGGALHPPRPPGPDAPSSQAISLAVAYRWRGSPTSARFSISCNSGEISGLSLRAGLGRAAAARSSPPKDSIR